MMASTQNWRLKQHLKPQLSWRFEGESPHLIQSWRLLFTAFSLNWDIPPRTTFFFFWFSVFDIVFLQILILLPPPPLHLLSPPLFSVSFCIFFYGSLENSTRLSTETPPLFNPWLYCSHHSRVIPMVAGCTSHILHEGREVLPVSIESWDKDQWRELQVGWTCLPAPPRTKVTASILTCYPIRLPPLGGKLTVDSFHSLELTARYPLPLRLAFFLARDVECRFDGTIVSPNGTQYRNWARQTRKDVRFSPHWHSLGNHTAHVIGHTSRSTASPFRRRYMMK